MSTTRPSRPAVGLTIATAALVLGALVIRSGAFFGLALAALIFVPLERVLALHPQRVFRKGWRTDIVHFLTNGILITVGLIVAVVAVGGTLHALVPNSVRLAVASQPAWFQAVEALIAVEFVQYWAHRASHTLPWLWKFHKVHHSIEEMDWLAAARLHPIDATFTRASFIIPLYALGFTRGTFGVVIVVLLLQALFVHANVRVRFGALRYVIATPEFHHWHHAADPAAYNSNFAGEFPAIDKLFGTLHLPAGERPSGYGIGEPLPDGYLRQLAWPFRHDADTYAPV